MLLRIDHVGIACHDLDEKIAFYEKVFDVTVVSREINEEQGVNEAMLHIADGEGGGSYIQLVQPLGPDTPVGRFLERRGEGIHHIAVRGAGPAEGHQADGGHRRARARQGAPAWGNGHVNRVSSSERCGRSVDRAGGVPPAPVVAAKLNNGLFVTSHAESLSGPPIRQHQSTLTYHRTWNPPWTGEPSAGPPSDRTRAARPRAGSARLGGPASAVRPSSGPV